MFWNDVFKEVISKKPNAHLLLILRVKFDDENMGHKSLAHMRRVNFEDKELFKKKYSLQRIGLLTDSYQDLPCSQIIFNYIEVDGVAPDTSTFLTTTEHIIKNHSFNNMTLPLSMNPSDYGVLISENLMERKGVTRFVVEGSKGHILL